jgi:hypothetical protein
LNALCGVMITLRICREDVVGEQRSRLVDDGEVRPQQFGLLPDRWLLGQDVEADRAELPVRQGAEHRPSVAESYAAV